MDDDKREVEKYVTLTWKLYIENHSPAYTGIEWKYNNRDWEKFYDYWCWCRKEYSGVFEIEEAAIALRKMKLSKRN